MNRKSRALAALAAERDAYAGQWVALLDGRVIASCPDAAGLPALLNLAHERGATIDRIPAHGTIYVLNAATC
jgi:hypothetical protein